MATNRCMQHASTSGIITLTFEKMKSIISTAQNPISMQQRVDMRIMLENIISSYEMEDPEFSE